MAIGPVRNGIALHGGVPQQDPQKIAEAARQLETQFAKMLISSMRATSLGDAMFPGDSQQYRDLYDAKLAENLTRGDGLGLQPMIRRQLGGTPDVQKAIGEAAKAYSMDGYRRLPGALHGVRPAPTPSAKTLPLARPLPAPIPLSALDVVGRADSVAAAVPPVDAALPGAPGVAATPAEPPAFKAGSPDEFVARVWPHAQRAAAELGVDPKVLVAQAALETGWGRHTIHGKAGVEAHNLFGIKAGGRWHGAAQVAETTEVVDGRAVRENAAFRAYRSVADSFSDYVSLLKNSPRYAAALGNRSVKAFATALQRAGYATDPHYAAKLTAIAEGPTLNRALARLDGPTA